MEIAADGAPPADGGGASSNTPTTGRSRRRWSIALTGVLLLAGLVAIIAVFAGKANKKVQMHEMLMMRIEGQTCFPMIDSRLTQTNITHTKIIPKGPNSLGFGHSKHHHHPERSSYPFWF